MDDMNRALGIKVPKDAEGTERKYTLTINHDGETIKVPLDNDELKKLYRDWQMDVPGFVVVEPMGYLEMDNSISPREMAIVNNALAAYRKAGRLNTEWNEDIPLPGEPGYKHEYDDN